MFCTNCGTQIEKDDRFCINCGKPVTTSITSNIIEEGHSKMEVKQIKKEEDDKKANILCILSLLFTYGLNIFPILSYRNNYNTGSRFLSGFSGLFPLIGLVLMIIARVKYPNNKFAKVVMWIYIISLLGMVLLFIVVMIACYSIISSCRGMG